MANSILQYLAEVEERLGNSVEDFALQEILAETESHLRESAEEIRSLGYNRREAEQRAVAAFGAAEAYGVAVQQAESVTKAPKSRLVVITATAVTGLFLLWPLCVRSYTWVHVNETLAAMSVAIVPVLLVGAAALSGSRARARVLFAIAFAGGVLLTPILATRFVGSGMEGGIVVRSIQLRSSLEGKPAEFRSYATAYQAALKEVVDYRRETIRGVIPAEFLPGPLTNSEARYITFSNIAFPGPAPTDPERIDSVPTPLAHYHSTEESMHAWAQYGLETQQRDSKAAAAYLENSEDAQYALDESFLSRWLSMITYAPLMTVLWGALLLLMQTAGATIRNLTLAILRLTGWTKSQAHPGYDRGIS